MSDVSKDMLDKWNDPEYRWYHKEEMSGLLVYSSERINRGILTINYKELREKNDAIIKERTVHNLNWIKFKELIDRIPNNLDRSDKKTPLTPKDRLHFETRDKGLCYLCGSVYRYGSCNVYSSTQTTYKLSHLHHIIPNGRVTDDNILTLCTHCHQLIHHALFISGKWKYARPL